MTTTKLNKHRDYWEERAKRFGSMGKGHKAICSYGMPLLYNAYINIIQKRSLFSVLHVKEGESILELGCGVGRWSLELARLGAEVTGVDISEEMIRIARENAENKGLSLHFINSSIADLKMEQGSFDNVLSVTVLQHVLTEEEFKESIAVISRALKPGGRFILLESAPDKEIKRLDTAIFTARTSGFYKTICEANNLYLEDIRSVDPSPFKRWILPYYKDMPRGLRGMLITIVSMLSLFIDILFAGTSYLIQPSWHKVMVFKKQ